MSFEEVEEDLVLSADDVVEVLEDDGEAEPMEEDQDGDAEMGEAPTETEPMIKDVEGEPRERPDNAVAGTCE
jgi:hypothetical protein